MTDQICICDTCAGDGLPCYTRLYLLNPDDSPEKPCARYSRRRESRWHALFGTPERAARTAYTMSECCGVACKGCPMDGVCYDEAALLEWLEAEVD